MKWTGLWPAVLPIVVAMLAAQPALAQTSKMQGPGMRSTGHAQRTAAAMVKVAAGLTPSAAAAIAAPAPGATPDYFGPFSNYANSPLPSGSISLITVTSGGAGYSASPVVTISDVYGAAPVATTATVTGGVITAIAIPAGTFTAPVVNISDATGAGAAATATILPTPGTGIRKFVDPMPALIVGTPDIVTYPGSHYYEIELGVYSTWSFHTDLLPAEMRGYRQTNLGTANVYDAVTNPTGCVAVAPIPTGARLCTAADNTVVPPAAFSYLGPTLVAVRNVPTRIKFTNNLPATSVGGNLPIPVDTTVMGAGSGYDAASNTLQPYSQNRGTLHLHGGFTPWVSDGTPHQWVVPAAEDAATVMRKGVSNQSVPDMPAPGGGSMTFYYPNQQSGRLMFYHDHAYGITRLNVYAGEAAGYLLVDPVERALTSGATAGIPAMPDVPLVIQDRSFVWGTAPVVTNGVVTTPGTGTWATDPTWSWASTMGSLWFPHVYMPNQNPWDITGANAMGRWDYALWFWPPFTGIIANPTVPNPYYDPLNAPWEPPEIPGTPNPSLVPEAFMDTPVVNGKAYPVYQAPAGPVRLRILNASNDRFLNLSLFVAADNTTPTTATTSGPTTRMCNGQPGVIVANCTEVKMVPFNSSQNLLTPFPSWWYTPGLNFTFDDRAGGVPDPTTRGPAMVQIGTEGGLLPFPAVIKNQPVNFDYNRRSIVVLNVLEKALFLGPAERADVIVDFSGFAGMTLILYNDSPAPVPAADLRIDYYTGAADQTATGGAPTTLPGYGPNTRTVMQIQVAGTGGTGVPDAVPGFLPALNTALPAAFAASQDPIVVPQVAYNAAYPSSPVAADVVGVNASSIQATSLTFTPLFSTTPLTFNMGSKAIQELFELDYGRMNATLGVELPFTNGGNQTTIPLGYIDPPTELIAASKDILAPQPGDGTQIWKITHNGVDTHAIHVHLFNVQVVNRVGWDGAIRMPDANELGWKETVRMNPLEDIIVALRPTMPLLPFGLPDSIRYLDVTAMPNSTGQFSGVDPNGNPVTVTNQPYNFGWEYVWHCHLLGHEENDMMRPTVFNTPRLLPLPPTGVTYARPGGGTVVNLTWVDPTPAATSLGDPTNEIGFKIQRATVGKNGKPGAYAVLPATATQPWPLANQTTYTDSTAVVGTNYSYQVVAYNAAGSTTSAAVPGIATGTLPADPSGMAAVLIAGPQVRLTWVDNSNNETSFAIERQVNGTPFSALASVGAGVTTYTSAAVTAGNTYTYRVKAVNASGSSNYSTSGPVPVIVPASPSGLIADPVQVGRKTDALTIRWTDNSTNELNFTVARCTGTAAACALAGAVWTNLTTTLPPGTVAYNDTGLTKGSTYSYRVRATNLAGASGWSNVIAVPMP
ncbi:MAG TPA: hypothetical protein VFM53_07000 [Anaeromyxobacteraceae bacterium]|nr:hypothetical protein [Anaeromyxobacteraceae bacterium]